MVTYRTCRISLVPYAGPVTGWLIELDLAQWSAGDDHPLLERYRKEVPREEVNNTLNKFLYELDVFREAVVHVNGQLVCSFLEAGEIARWFLDQAKEPLPDHWAVGPLLTYAGCRSAHAFQGYWRSGTDR